MNKDKKLEEQELETVNGGEYKRLSGISNKVNVINELSFSDSVNRIDFDIDQHELLKSKTTDTIK